MRGTIYLARIISGVKIHKFGASLQLELP